MIYLQLFESFSSLYQEVNQHEFDSLLESNKLFSFSKIDMKKINDILSNEGYKSFYADSTIQSYNNKFLMCDDFGLDKSISSDKVYIDNGEKIIEYNKDDTDKNNHYLESDDEGYYYMKIPNYSLIIKGKKGILSAFKCNDEWFLVCIEKNMKMDEIGDFMTFDDIYPTSEYEMYKCDQFDGLIKLLKIKIDEVH